MEKEIIDAGKEFCNQMRDASLAVYEADSGPMSEYEIAAFVAGFERAMDIAADALQSVYLPISECKH